MLWLVRTVLNRGGEGGHPCLVPDPRGKAFSLSTLSVGFAVDFSYVALYM